MYDLLLLTIILSLKLVIFLEVLFFWDPYLFCLLLWGAELSCLIVLAYLSSSLSLDFFLFFLPSPYDSRYFSYSCCDSDLKITKISLFNNERYFE